MYLHKHQQQRAYRQNKRKVKQVHPVVYLPVKDDLIPQVNTETYYQVDAHKIHSRGLHKILHNRHQEDQHKDDQVDAREKARDVGRTAFPW